MPALVSCPESAMVKQPACAAAINSSGFVPMPFSNRVENEYCAFERTLLSVEMVPLPSLSEPFQTAEAFRTIGHIPPERLDLAERKPTPCVPFYTTISILGLISAAVEIGFVGSPPADIELCIALALTPSYPIAPFKKD